MTAITYVPLKNDLLVRLIGRDGAHYEGLIDYAVQDYLDRTEDDFGATSQSRNGDGYNWDQLYLPEGTLVRTRYKGAPQVAKVAEGRFEYDGKHYESPSKVCNSMRGDTSNNAWQMLEVKRPQDVDYRRADGFRR